MTVRTPECYPLGLDQGLHDVHLVLDGLDVDEAAGEGVVLVHAGIDGGERDQEVALVGEDDAGCTRPAEQSRQ